MNFLKLKSEKPVRLYEAFDEDEYYDDSRSTYPQGSLVRAWTKNVLFEQEAQRQIANISRLPFIHSHVAVMPDVHAGIGATVGSVIPTKGAVIPAAVGVDIGCGMAAVRLNIKAHDLPTSLAEMRSKIEANVPHGRTNNGRDGDRGAWGSPPADVECALKLYYNHDSNLMKRYEALVEAHPKIYTKAVPTQLGTLGTGNHFIEVCLDEKQDVWVMLHSGSRGPGNAIGRYFIALAREEMQRWFVDLPDKDLAYLPEGSEYFDDYIKAVSWAQDYALTNRNIMMQRVIGSIQSALPGILIGTTAEAIFCHHNYVSKENHFGENIWVTRKGAVSARKNQLGIIPGSMGARSYIVRGLGNPDSFTSCSHGAGRAMSRTAAAKKFTVEDHIKATAGVECRKDLDVIDETPGAYKDIDAVMEAQKDLVEVVHTLKQVVCIKG